MGGFPDAKKSRRRLMRGFTLIELLVVISVIILLIGILLPALTGAGRAARGAKTKAIMRDVLAAVDAFQVQNRRAPGHFSQIEMGAQENANGPGFTQMENALLDLAGGIVDKAGMNNPQPGNDFRDVGPFDDDDKLVRVDRTLVGAESEGAFLSLDDDTLRPATGQAGETKAAGPSAIGPKDMLDVIDAFSVPVMMWARDLGGPNAINQVTDFAREASPTSAGDKALFYWNTNAGYLDAFSLNGSNHQQRNDSALGGSLDRQLRERNLAAALGSPAFPSPSDLSIPAQPRGSVILISAGQDDGYFAMDGARADKIMGYGPRRGSPGQESVTGPDADSFDDIILSTGG